MKPIIISDSKTSRRALCALLIGIAAFWAMPRNACAQIYVGESDSVGKYDATSGTAISANFITGLNQPTEPSALSMIALGSVAMLGITHRKKHRTG